MADESQGFAFINDEVTPVGPVIAIQIDAESDLQKPKMAELAPSSWAYMPGWEHAWQKKNDGTWKTVR